MFPSDSRDRTDLKSLSLLSLLLELPLQYITYAGSEIRAKKKNAAARNLMNWK